MFMELPESGVKNRKFPKLKSISASATHTNFHRDSNPMKHACANRKKRKIRDIHYDIEDSPSLHLVHTSEAYMPCPRPTTLMHELMCGSTRHRYNHEKKKMRAVK